MNASRAAVIVVGVNLIAVWAAAAAGGRTGPPATALTAPRVTPDQAVGEAYSSLVTAARRLEAHARGHRASAPASRDPFQFGNRGGAIARGVLPLRLAPVPAGPAAAAAPPLLAEPEFVLQGMAESQDGEAVVRTAILRAGSDLLLATIGARVGDRYEVVALTPDSVELENVIDHTRRTCRMK
jgi:hypothetical protein